ncbi:hypothetical protein ACXYTP_25100 [Tsukamurella ocularis]
MLNDHNAARLEDIRIANAQPNGPFRWPDGAIVFNDTWSQWWTWQRAGAPGDAWEEFRAAPPPPPGPVTMCFRGYGPKGSDLRGLDDGDEGGAGVSDHLPWPLGDEPDSDGPEFGA